MINACNNTRMKIKYIPVFVKDMEEAVCFFTNKLGFSLADKMVLHDEAGYTTLRVRDTDTYLNLLVDTESTGSKTQLIFNTDDCLNDYHNLKTMGVDFKEQPQYLAIGLSAEFYDNYGNQYILLEERNYSEL